MSLIVIKCSETGIHASWPVMNSRKGQKHCEISYLKRKEHVLAIFWWIGPVIQNWTLVAWISTRTFHIASVLAVTIVLMLHTELAFAMIASQSNKPHQWHLALHHKYEPRRRRKSHFIVIPLRKSPHNIKKFEQPSKKWFQSHKWLQE